MAVEAVLIKPVVDAILGLFDRGQKAKLQSNARKALREAIRELLLADPNENEAAAKIAIGGRHVGKSENSQKAGRQQKACA
jgi:hypothetical protein